MKFEKSLDFFSLCFIFKLEYKRRITVQLVILGFLKERDYYGYELKKEIQKRIEEHEELIQTLKSVHKMIIMAETLNVKQAIIKNSIYHVEAELTWLHEVQELQCKKKLFQ
ncbi:PadR family transcriptional regulator [bacterium]|nr:PadR family transcriptional regulator [bacterium]MBU1651354.1 PadR family transcriptional regulator [bacterium]MBU1880988.1 PadR family transcriptional regulator [bacterium]